LIRDIASMVIVKEPRIVDSQYCDTKTIAVVILNSDVEIMVQKGNSLKDVLRPFSGDCKRHIVK